VISRLQGTVLTRDIDRVEVETGGGVVYEVQVPLPVLERVPAPGGTVELRTVHVVTETSASLYGFIEAHERRLFQRLLSASGVGPKVALAMMSTYSAERLARALVEKDIAALQQVSGVGKKTAERMVLELADKMADLAIASPSGWEGSRATRDAVQALVTLGYTFGDADQAVRGALQDGAPGTTEELIRRALAG
jgi:Holliday junction DNA helicase RuvA